MARRRTHPEIERLTSRRGVLNEARWEEILTAAGAEFYDKGFRAARLQDIAARVGLLTGSLYYYIDSKEDLLFELADWAHRLGVTSVIEEADVATSDAPTRLRGFIARHVLVLTGFPWESSSVILENMSFLTPEHRARVTSMRRKLHAFVRGIIEQGIADGDFDRRHDPGVTTNVILTLVNATTNWARPGPGRMSLAEIGDWYSQLFTLGLAPGAPESPVIATDSETIARDLSGSRQLRDMASGTAREARLSVNEQRRLEILDAAAIEFREVGFGAARLQDIAARVGLLAGSLYHYIDSKEQLLYELLKSTHDAGISNVIARDAPVGDARMRLRRLIVHWGQGTRTARAAVAERDLKSLSPEHRAEIVAKRRVINSLVQDIVKEGIDEGCFDPQTNPAVAASSILTALNVSTGWFRPSGVLTHDELFLWFGDLFVRGMAPVRVAAPVALGSS